MPPSPSQVGRGLPPRKHPRDGCTRFKSAAARTLHPPRPERQRASRAAQRPRERPRRAPHVHLAAVALPGFDLVEFGGHLEPASDIRDSNARLRQVLRLALRPSSCAQALAPRSERFKHSAPDAAGSGAESPSDTISPSTEASRSRRRARCRLPSPPSYRAAGWRQKLPNSIRSAMLRRSCQRGESRDVEPEHALARIVGVGNVPFAKRVVGDEDRRRPPLELPSSSARMRASSAWRIAHRHPPGPEARPDLAEPRPVVEPLAHQDHARMQPKRDMVDEERPFTSPISTGTSRRRRSPRRRPSFERDAERAGEKVHGAERQDAERLPAFAAAAAATRDRAVAAADHERLVGCFSLAVPLDGRERLPFPSSSLGGDLVAMSAEFRQQASSTPPARRRGSRQGAALPS